MICLDTDFLIALWRSRGTAGHPTRRVLEDHPGEVLAVCAVAAGEFLEGAACVSEERLREATRFLRLFEIAPATFQTAVHYAQAVAELRRRGLLAGISKADMWIAAAALEHRVRLVTRNTRHFERIAGLRLIAF